MMKTNGMVYRVDADTLGNRFLDEVNCMGFDSMEAAKAIMADTSMSEIFFEICAAWVSRCSQKFRDGDYDARNEYPCMVADGLCSLEGIQTILPGEYARTVAETVGKGHRTLQGSFSGLAFRFLDMNRDSIEGLSDYSADKPGWYRCPYI